MQTKYSRWLLRFLPEGSVTKTHETVEKHSDEKNPFALFGPLGIFFSFFFYFLQPKLGSSTLPSMTELIAALEIAPAVLCSVRWPLIETAQKRSIGAVGVLSPLPDAV